MSDYELWSMFMASGQAAELHLQNFTALLFGFLIAAYLVADRLDRLMVAIVLFLFSAMALRFALVFFFTSDDIVALAEQIKLRSMEPESAISWLKIGPVHLVFNGVFLVMLLSYIAATLFFFHIRRQENGQGIQDLPQPGAT